MEIPDELEAALDANSAARRAFDRMPPSHQREYATHVAEAVQAETRIRRAERMVELILDEEEPG
jgi:uncharacterized protein YdeI (YjbR/CyaY-like superfamily)